MYHDAVHSTLQPSPVFNAKAAATVSDQDLIVALQSMITYFSAAISRCIDTVRIADI